MDGLPALRRLGRRRTGERTFMEHRYSRVAAVEGAARPHKRPGIIPWADSHPAILSRVASLLD